MICWNKQYVPNDNLLPDVLLSHSEKSANDIDAKELLPEHSLEVLKRLKIHFKMGLTKTNNQPYFRNLYSTFLLSVIWRWHPHLKIARKAWSGIIARSKERVASPATLGVRRWPPLLWEVSLMYIDRYNLENKSLLHLWRRFRLISCSWESIEPDLLDLSSGSFWLIQPS